MHTVFDNLPEGVTQEQANQILNLIVKGQASGFAEITKEETATLEAFLSAHNKLYLALWSAALRISGEILMDRSSKYWAEKDKKESKTKKNCKGFNKRTCRKCEDFSLCLTRQ